MRLHSPTSPPLLVAWLAVIGALCSLGCNKGSAAPPAAVRLSGVCMGTTWSAVLDVDPGSAVRAQVIIQAALDHVDAKLSTWKSDSDLSRIARAEGGVPVPIAEVTYDVLSKSDQWVEESGGAFDPTVGPLVSLWGFARHEPNVAKPSADAIEDALGKLGWSELEITDTTVTKARAEIAVDASAIAKGYGVDIAARALEESGVNNFLLEVGGEIVVRGTRHSGEKWLVGIDDPLPPGGFKPGPDGSLPTGPSPGADRPSIARIHVTDAAVATSGDYFNTRLVEGRVVAHAIDPRTGRPTNHDLASVTVVAPDCTSADALATAALVLGPDAALELLEGVEHVEGLLLIRTHGGDSPLEWRQTSGLSKYRLERRTPTAAAGATASPSGG